MDFRLIGTAFDGAQTYARFNVDAAGNRVLEVREVTPAEVVNAITDANHEIASDVHVGRSSRGNTQRHRVPVARIPVSLYWQMRAKLGEPRDNPSGWKAWLNDPENRLFRTSEGTV